jgi:hypothetical protein
MNSSRHPFLIVMDALLRGHGVHIGSEEYSLQQTEGGDWCVAVRRIKEYNSVKGWVSEKIYLDAQLPLNWFIRECKGLSEEELATIAMNCVLTDRNRNYSNDIPRYVDEAEEKNAN